VREDIVNGLNNIDPIVFWVVAGIVAALIVIALIVRGARRSRTVALREKYGREYDHAVKTSGSRSRAEQDLMDRAEEANTIQIRPLTAAEHSRFREDWNRIEMRFLERPTTAVVEAEELANEIMRTRGYPMGDFEKHAAMLSVKHPAVVEHYRAGHAAIDTNRDGKSSTEELRQAMLHYRALIEDLLATPRTDRPVEVPVEREYRDEAR
jgi:hypothetical protein